MKFLFYILFLFVSLQCLASVELSKQAENLYKNKDYKAAIEQYEMLVKQGLSSYKLYYNLGNAYYKNNELGKAIYSYELANKLQPNNDDIKTNLRIANQKTIDKIEIKENFFLNSIKSGLINFLSTKGWAWLSIISLISCLGLVFGFFISKHLVVKRISFFVAIVLFFVFLSSMMLGFSALNNKQKKDFAIILTKESKIYTEPGTASVSIFSLHEGTKVKVLETTTEWANIQLQNGNEGWVKSNDIGLF